jgi:hypothetical protein
MANWSRLLPPEHFFRCGISLFPVKAADEGRKI